MKYIFNNDFLDFILELNYCNVQYILVGGYAVILHGYSRSTGDLDIWTNPTEQNYLHLMKAFTRFGLPTTSISKADFIDTEKYDVYTFGLPPICIEILTQVKGLQFDNAFTNALWLQVSDSVQVRTLALSDLILSKKSAGRYKDYDDIEHLSHDL